MNSVQICSTCLFSALYFFIMTDMTVLLCVISELSFCEISYHACSLALLTVVDLATVVVVNSLMYERVAVFSTRLVNEMLEHWRTEVITISRWVQLYHIVTDQTFARFLNVIGATRIVSRHYNSCSLFTLPSS